MLLRLKTRAVFYLYVELALTLLFIMACGFLYSYYLPAAAASATNLPPATGRVVMVLVDGLRKDYAFDGERMPNLARLARAGASGTAQTTSFSQTICALRAIGSGTSYSLNDIIYNYIKRRDGLFPHGKLKKNRGTLDPRIDSIFNQAHQHGLKTDLSGDDLWVACFGSDIDQSVTIDGKNTDEGGETEFDITNDAEVHRGALKFLTAGDFNILIVHYVGLDKTGHNYTPLNPRYREKAKELDNYLAEIESHLPADATLLVFGDHGMTDEGWHSRIDNPPAIVRDAPFVFAKNGVRKISGINAHQQDLTPTLALLLGLPIPRQSEGIALVDAFQLSDQQKAAWLLANLRARHDFLVDVKNTGINLSLAPIDAAEKSYTQADYRASEATALAQLQTINKEAEEKIKFHLPPAIVAIIGLALLSGILLLLMDKNDIYLPLVARISMIYLLASPLLAMPLAQLSSWPLFPNAILAIIACWLLALAIFLLIRLLGSINGVRERSLIVLVLPVVIVSALPFSPSMIILLMLSVACYLIVRKFIDRPIANLNFFAAGGLIVLTLFFKLSTLPSFIKFTEKPAAIFACYMTAQFFLFFIYARLMKRRGVVQLTRSEIVIMATACLAMTATLAARGLNETAATQLSIMLGYGSTMLAFAISVLLPARRIIKTSAGMLIITSMLAMEFNPFHFLIALASLIVAIEFLPKFVVLTRRTPLLSTTAYLLINGLIFYQAFGGISLNSFFESGRVEILGAGITDYSNRNIAAIVLLIILKLVTVESIALCAFFFALRKQTRIENFINNTAAALFGALLIFAPIIWWQYKPAQQKELGVLTNVIIYLAIRILIMLIASLLLSAANRSKTKFTWHKVPPDLQPALEQK